MNLGENGGPYANMLRVQLICGIFQTILGFLNIKFYNNENSDYGQIQEEEEVDSSTFSTQAARNAEAENAGPPQYDDIVAEFDRLPSYQEASEKAKRKGRKLEKVKREKRVKSSLSKWLTDFQWWIQFLRGVALNGSSLLSFTGNGVSVVYHQNVLLLAMYSWPINQMDFIMVLLFWLYPSQSVLPKEATRKMRDGS